MEKCLPSKVKAAVLKKSLWFFTVAFMLIQSYGSAQVSVQGKVTSAEDNEGLPGVSILVRGTNQGTITAVDGSYKISVNDPEAVLEFSFIGYASQRIKIAGQSVIDVVLEIDIQSLDEVVVVGYGEQLKKEVTGAVGQVDAETLTQTASADLGAALQGQIAGVNVVASSGQPGSESNIIIRGLSSVTGANAPLFVVDGIPYNGDPRLSINEIEKIDVLKDAASASVYGTRGAGGVILITTKRGKEGQMKIGVDSYVGFQKITSGISLMNFEESFYQRFAQLNHANGTNFNAWTPLVPNRYGFTNRADLTDVLQNDNAMIQNHSLSVSGGKDGLTYNIVGNYFNQEGVLINSGFQRYNVRANTSYRKKKWTIITGLGFRIEEQDYEPWGLLLQAYRYQPFQPQIDPNLPAFQDIGAETEGNILTGMAARLKQTDRRQGSHFNLNLETNYQLTKDIRLTTRLGSSLTDNTRVRVNPLFEAFDVNGDPFPMAERSGVYNRSDRASSLIWENSILYSKEFGDHNIKLFGLYSMEKYTFTSFWARRFDLVSNDVTVLDGASLDPVTGSRENPWDQDRINSLIGMLGRVQYSYKGRYLLSISARRDGSSRFSEKFRWGIFPSVSAGWNVSDEAFWSPLKSTINTFKLRGSYGTTGNQNFLDYSNAATITLMRDYVFGPESDDRLVLGAIQTAYANENIKWETTVQQNIGFDIALLNHKLTFTGDFYNTNKKDMLFPQLLPTSTGGGQNATVTLNVGDMNNRGMEFATNYRHSGVVSWSIGGTYAMNRNKITKMSGANKFAFLPNSRVVDGVPGEDLVTALREGYEAGAFFLIPTDGIIKNQEELETYRELVPTAQLGDLRYIDALTVDTNGDGIPDAGDGQITEEDRVYAGSGMPDFELGLNFSMAYKGFDLSMQWYGAFGGEVMNGSKAYAYKYSTHKDLIYQWTPQNNTSDIPANRGTEHFNYRGFTDYWLEDGTFVRLRNIALGYSLPTAIIDKLGVSKFRIYMSAQNPITITGYEGFDPEVGNNGLQTRGLDKGNYPISSIYRGGIQVDF